MADYPRTKEFPPDDSDETKLRQISNLQAFVLVALNEFLWDFVGMKTLLWDQQSGATVTQLHTAIEKGLLPPFARNQTIVYRKQLTRAVIDVTLRDLRNWPWPLLLIGPDTTHDYDDDAPLAYQLHPMTLPDPYTAFIIQLAYQHQRHRITPFTLRDLRSLISIRKLWFHDQPQYIGPDPKDEASWRYEPVFGNIKWWNADKLLNRAIRRKYLKASIDSTLPTPDPDTSPELQLPDISITYLPRSHAEYRYIAVLARQLSPYLPLPFDLDDEDIGTLFPTR